MEEAVVLRARHNLVGRSILPLVTRLARMEGPPPEWARLTREVELTDYTEADLRREFQGLTGHPLDETLAAAQKGTELENLRVAVHCTIGLANKIGLPRGQQPQNQAGQQRDDRQGRKRPHEETEQVRARVRRGEYSGSYRYNVYRKHVMTQGAQGQAAGHEVLGGKSTVDLA